MEQINHNYADYYYLTLEGNVFNANSNAYIKPDKSHRFKLKQIDNSYKSISLKTLYKLVYNQTYCIDEIKDLEDEEWRVINNTDSLYFVSSLGRVKSYQGYKAIILKPYTTPKGYEKVDIVEHGQRQTKFVHRLVAAAFLPLPNGIDYQLHHKDKLPNSNAASNLVWLSPAEHRKAHKTSKETKINV